MTWIKIDRDENGFATDSALNVMFAYCPCVLLLKETETGYSNFYMVVTKQLFRDYSEKHIRPNRLYTHYLPIPKAPAV